MKSTISIYISTFAKYNAGSLQGEWVNIADFFDYDEFVEHCKELHEDEADPEFMCQDFEGIPAELQQEAGLPDVDTFWVLRQLADMDDEQREAFDAFVGAYGIHHDDIMQAFEDSYQGEWDSEEDFAENLWQECGFLNEMPEQLQCYIDWQAVARDLFIDDYYFDGVNVFSRA